MKNKDGYLKQLFSADDTVNGASLLPIRLTMFYLIFSVAVYSFGPLEWITYRPVLFYTLLALYMAALWFGYRVGVKKRFSTEIQWSSDYEVRIAPVLSVLIAVNYLVYAVNIFRDYGMQTFDFAELFRQMAVGLKNPGLGYVLRNARVESISSSEIVGGKLFTLFNYLWAFVRYPILLMALLQFRKLKIWGKFFVAAYMVTMFLFYLSIGTTIDILHIFLLIELPAILNAFSCWYRKKMNVKQAVRLIASLLAGILIVCGYFTWMMLSRGGINNYDKPGYNVGGIQIEDNLISTEKEETEPAESDSDQTKPDKKPAASTGFRVPRIVMKFWISFSSYFTQGYYGMSQAITLPWTPMFGLGSSMFVVNFVSEHVYDVDQFTYQMKNEQIYGWDSDVQWNCMYTWLANDFSFYGVVLAMLLIGILFGAMFKDAIATENPFAKISVFYFMLMMLFIPCNNQIAQRPDTLFSFALIVLCWLVSKRPFGILRKRRQVKAGEESNVCKIEQK